MHFGRGFLRKQGPPCELTGISDESATLHWSRTGDAPRDPALMDTEKDRVEDDAKRAFATEIELIVATRIFS